MENTPNSGGTTPGRKSNYQNIDDYLERVTTTLTNALLPEAGLLLANRGYPATEIQARLADAEGLRTLDEQQQKEYGEQYEASQAYRLEREALHDEYMDHVKLARVVFKKATAAKTALGLRGDRAASQGGYVSQGLQFYKGALENPDYSSALQGKGIMGTNLTEGKEAFEYLQKLTAAQQKETGEAQTATKARDAALDALQEWMSDFYETAKVALRKHPQLMEQLGIKEAS